MKKKDSEKTIFVTQGNYYSNEMAKIYTGSTQIKSFLQCESKAMAELNGEWQEDTSKSMLVSSYIDAWMSDELEDFKQQHPDIFLKNGELKADYKLAENVIEQIKQDPIFMKYISGEHQVIMTGEVSGVPVKIRIDSYFPGKAIVDLKCMSTLVPQWSEETHSKLNFCDAYRYTLQAALYQEIVYQNTGEKLPFIIAVATKEKISRKALLEIPQHILDKEMQFLKEYLVHLKLVKTKQILPESCENCDFCMSKKKVDGVWNYQDFFDKYYKQN